MSTLRTMLIVGLIIGGCDATVPFLPFAVDNDPVPLKGDPAVMLDSFLEASRLRLDPADPVSPPISARRALEIAGADLLEQLRINRVPAQDPMAPDGLIRRRYVDPGRAQRPQMSVWIVVYRWKAGFDCHSPDGGPGPCPATSFFFIDDQSGEMVKSDTIT